MAWRYKQLKPASGDTIYTEDWELNHQEMASEFNGYLDRDNFREGVFSYGRSPSDNAPLIAKNAFNVFHKNQFYSRYCKEYTTFDNNASGWTSVGFQNNSNTETNFCKTTVDLDFDALLSIEFSCHFEWNPTAKMKGSDHAWIPEDSDGDLTGLAMPESDDNEFNSTVLVNDFQGNADEEKSSGYGWFLASGTQGDSNALYEGTAIFESDVYQDSGDIRSYDAKTKESFVTGPFPLYGACAFRVTVDGTTVCESGWFSDHREKENLYLVGAIAVGPGSHEIVVETRKGFVSNEKPNVFTPKLAKPVVMYDRELIIHARYR